MQSTVLNGRYELFAPIGQGGMATVYRGRDLRLGRPVAIKLLHNYYAADDEFLQRFAHEAMSAAHLSAHPHIVDVYDVGQDGDQNYIVMELIEGEDLKAIIDAQAPLPIDYALSITAQVADGLEYAHRRGLVHRDVKPQNILITSDGQVRIADFGIAKSHLSTAVTQAGITFGTADYISPEQAQGLVATPQSDIYSLGVVLYEMLTGALPFTGDTPMAVAIQHIQQQPPPLRHFNGSIPPALEAIVQRTLAKNPQQRPPSAQAFAQELRDYIEGRFQPTVAVPSPVRPAANVPRRPAQPQPQRAVPAPPASTTQRRPAQRPQYVAPPLAVAPPRERGGFGFGTLLIGLLLLGGVLTLAYVGINTDWSNFLNFSGGTVGGPARPSTVPEPSPTGEPTSTPVPVVALPDFVGQPEADVVSQINQLGLVRRADPNDPAIQPRYDLAPAGTVIEQTPLAGTEVEQGSEIAIVVSLGPEFVDVPDVTRRRFADAKAALEATGFVVQQRIQPNRTVQAGIVVSQDPQANVSLPKGEVVTLTVSAGDVVAFPNVVANGTLQPEARQAVEAAGFNIVAVDVQGPDRLSNFNRFQADEVVSATADGIPIDVPGKLVPRGANVVIAVRAP